MHYPHPVSHTGTCCRTLRVGSLDGALLDLAGEKLQSLSCTGNFMSATDADLARGGRLAHLTCLTSLEVRGWNFKNPPHDICWQNLVELHLIDCEAVPSLLSTPTSLRSLQVLHIDHASAMRAIWDLDEISAGPRASMQLFGELLASLPSLRKLSGIIRLPDFIAKDQLKSWYLSTEKLSSTISAPTLGKVWRKRLA